ncbi:MAG TPA: YitT family protein, partial [Ureibacillus sp.]|nr:YitT family protein [Ureibacillus sp.]
SILFSRTLQYLLFMILAIIFGGPIGIGTVITLFLGGPILSFFMPIVEKRLDAFLLRREARFT